MSTLALCLGMYVIGALVTIGLFVAFGPPYDTDADHDRVLTGFCVIGWPVFWFFTGAVMLPYWVGAMIGRVRKAVGR